jgi:hypothetical protein
MPSSGMLRRVALVRTHVSEERRFLQEPHGVTSQKTGILQHTVMVEVLVELARKRNIIWGEMSSVW